MGVESAEGLAGVEGIEVGGAEMVALVEGPASPVLPLRVSLGRGQSRPNVSPTHVSTLSSIFFLSTTVLAASFLGDEEEESSRARLAVLFSGRGEAGRLLADGVSDMARFK